MTSFATLQVGNFESDSVTVDKLMRFFKFNLVFCSIAKFESVIERCFCFGLEDIVAVICCVDEYFYVIIANFDDTTTNGDKFELIVGVVFFAAYRYNTRYRDSHERFVVRKNSNVAIRRRDDYFVGRLTDCRAFQRDKFEIHIVL